MWITPQTRLQVSLLSCPRACQCMSQRMEAFYAIKQPSHVHVKRDTSYEDIHIYISWTSMLFSIAVGAPNTQILSVRPLAFPLGHPFAFTISAGTSWPHYNECKARHVLYQSTPPSEILLWLRHATNTIRNIRVIRSDISNSICVQMGWGGGVVRGRWVKQLCDLHMFTLRTITWPASPSLRLQAPGLGASVLCSWRDTARGHRLSDVLDPLEKFCSFIFLLLLSSFLVFLTLCLAELSICACLYTAGQISY